METATFEIFDTVLGAGGVASVLGIWIFVLLKQRDQRTETIKEKDKEITRLNEARLNDKNECMERIENLLKENNTLLKEGRKVGDQIYGVVNNGVLQEIKDGIDRIKKQG